MRTPLTPKEYAQDLIERMDKQKALELAVQTSTLYDPTTIIYSNFDGKTLNQYTAKVFFRMVIKELEAL